MANRAGQTWPRMKAAGLPRASKQLWCALSGRFATTCAAEAAHGARCRRLCCPASEGQQDHLLVPRCQLMSFLQGV